MSTFVHPTTSANTTPSENLVLWASIAIAYLPLPLKSAIALTSWNDTPGKVLNSAIISLGHTPKLLFAVTMFALTIVILHGLLGYFAWRIFYPICAKLNFSGKQRLLLAILFFLILQIGIISLNGLLFPNSAMKASNPWFFIALTFLFVTSVICWHTVQWFKSHQNKSHSSFVVLSIFSLMLIGFLMPSEAEHHLSSQRTQPDIIIIGLDSFRPDHLKQPGDTNSITPNLDAFLSNAYRFDKTYTPMARTYPAWMSILTGRYPVEHGARFNLLDPKYLKSRDLSLPFYLKSKGYTTAYTIDETRFSNIDRSYGFDITVTPEIGATDFLIASATDLPLRNLLSLIPNLNSAIFPYQFINRAIHNTYEPNTFDKELNQAIESADPQKPLFLATHFELPHWPYDWRKSEEYSTPTIPRLKGLSPLAYQKSVSRADEQFSSLMESLKNSGRLNNAIVVVLSDHGEAFNQSAPFWQPDQTKMLLDIPLSKGHGISVIDEAQIRVLLGFKRFGDKNIPSGTNQRLTSLVDIAPTLLSLAGFDKTELKASGCDLFSAEVEDNCGNNRIVFTESGFYVPAMLTPGGLDEKKIAEQAQAYYDINPDTRLTFKTSALPQMFKDKQRAAIGDNWVVASLPQYGRKQFLAGDFNNHTYWNIDKIQIDKIEAFPKYLLPKLCQKYQGDDADLDAFCRRS